MIRFSLFVLLALAGCSRPVSPPTQKPTEPGGGRLTQDERIAWEKLRRSYKDDGLITLFALEEGRWRILHTSTSRDEEEKHAIRLVADPVVKAIAVVDLFSGDSPVILRWAYDDGKRQSLSDRPPAPGLEQTLKAHLVEEQREGPKATHVTVWLKQ